MSSLTYYIMFPWPMGIASQSSESTIPQSLRDSGLGSGAQVTALVTMVCGGNGGQNFFQTHTGGDLWRLKILERSIAEKQVLSSPLKTDLHPLAQPFHSKLLQITRSYSVEHNPAACISMLLASTLLAQILLNL